MCMTTLSFPKVHSNRLNTPQANVKEKDFNTFKVLLTESKTSCLHTLFT